MFYEYSHFIDGETEGESLNKLPKDTKRVSSKSVSELRQSGSNICSFNLFTCFGLSWKTPNTSNTTPHFENEEKEAQREGVTCPHQ